MAALPIRKKLNHLAPFPVLDAFHFVTICASDRGGTPFLEHATAILEAARNYHLAGDWWLAVCLVMPDHIHMIVHTKDDLAKTIGKYKHFLARKHKVLFQQGFFDTRIRNDEHFREKWNYTLRNPVVKGLVAMPREWPYVIAFNRITGEELPHK